MYLAKVRGTNICQFACSYVVLEEGMCQAVLFQSFTHLLCLNLWFIGFLLKDNECAGVSLRFFLC